MRVTEAERAAGALSPARLSQLVAAFDARGVFVLESVIPLDACRRLAPRMLSDAAAIVAHGGWGSRGEFGHGHLQLGPPRNAPFVSAEVVANPIIEQCVVAILRSKAKLGFCEPGCPHPTPPHVTITHPKHPSWTEPPRLSGPVVPRPSARTPITG